MNALVVLFAGRLTDEAFQPLIDGKNSVSLAVERACAFPGATKTVILADSGNLLTEKLSAIAGVSVETCAGWTKKALFETLATLGAGFDLTYFAWADCPFLDPALAGKIAERHTRYAAEYSCADGWPYGLAPELISPGTAALLAAILTKLPNDADSPVERDTLFAVIQKDINAFDIECEISPIDLRCHRLSFCADSKRNLLLLNRFTTVGKKISDTSEVENIIATQPDILRTLPNFYPIQVFAGCPQSCAVCPYPKIAGNGLSEKREFIDETKFETILEKIIAFSGDAVIDLSLWGEFALHPQKMKLIEAVLAKPTLALVIETSGLGWKNDELEHCAAIAKACAGRKSPLPPLSWIVSLDSNDPERYKEIRGAGYAEVLDCAKKLLQLFPKDTYVQAVRTEGAEDDIEKFYRSWKETAPNGAANIIIQKYDDFCGVQTRKQASDLSPVNRQPCWHIMRDMPILIDGTVPLCRENLAAVERALKGENQKPDERVMGNVFTDSLEDIWNAGQKFYAEQCVKKYEGICTGCDEYYTYNF